MVGVENTGIALPGAAVVNDDIFPATLLNLCLIDPLAHRWRQVTPALKPAAGAFRGGLQALVLFQAGLFDKNWRAEALTARCLTRRNLRRGWRGDGSGDASGITSGVEGCLGETVGLGRGVGSASSDSGVGLGVGRGVGAGVGTVFGLGRGVTEGLGRGTGRMSSRALRKSFLFSSSVT